MSESVKSEVSVSIDPDRVTIGFLCDLEEAAGTQSIRKLIDLYVNGLGIDRDLLRNLKASQIKDLGEQIRQVTMVGNANG